MKQQKDWIEKRQALRIEAAKAIASLSPPAVVAQPADMMMHELLVHKVELEMQVEELKSAHASLEEARDHYADYYESAPVGYLTIGRDGLIGEINMTGAAMLGVNRSALTNRRLAHFVSPRDRDRWHRLCLRMMEPAEADEQTFIFEMVRADGGTFDAYLHCRRMASPPVLRITLFDIGKIKQT